MPSVSLTGDAHAVAVRIRAEDAVRALAVGQLHRQLERRGVLGVGHPDGGEIRIGQLLLLHDQHVFNADFRKDPPHGLVARAVQGRVDDLELLARFLHELRLHGQGLYLRDVVVVHLAVADDLQKPRRASLFLVHLHRVLIGARADAREHLIRVFRRHLAPSSQ